MRECIRCGTEMQENCGLKAEGLRGASYLVLTKEDSLFFSGTLDYPKIAICPNCGEVSIYLEDVSKLKRQKK